MTTMTKDARLSDCKTYRWTLFRSWGDGPRVCWVMLNPSTADHKADDPTILRVIHFTRSWGYDGFTVVNLYPFRSSKPADCRRWSEWEPRAAAVLRENVAVVAEQARGAARVVAAWGNKAWDKAWVEQVVSGMGADLYCLGTTGGGAPKHPLGRGAHRIPDDQQPVLWRAARGPTDTGGCQD